VKPLWQYPIAGLLLPLAAWTGSSRQTPDQRPRFTTRVEAVRVDVLVTDRGRPVHGLRPQDFDVRDNGAKQNVDLVTAEQVPLNVILALDASDSVVGERLEHLRRATLALLEQLEARDQAAVLTFNHRLSLVLPFSTGRDGASVALRAMTGSGGTALYDATYAAMTLAKSTSGRNLVIVFTDGADTSSFLRREAVVDAARRANVVVYVVGAGLQGNLTFVHEVVEQTGGSLIQLESTSSLADTFFQVLSQFRERYLLSYIPQGVNESGWHRLEVLVRGRKLAVTARPGYHR
jgi:VWFA-related protein